MGFYQIRSKRVKKLNNFLTSVYRRVLKVFEKGTKDISIQYKGFYLILSTFQHQFSSRNFYPFTARSPHSTEFPIFRGSDVFVKGTTSVMFPHKRTFQFVRSVSDKRSKWKNQQVTHTQTNLIFYTVGPSEEWYLLVQKGE